MFTGIITGVGRIVAVRDLGSSLSHGKGLTLETPAAYLNDVCLGDSIALNGACMTVTALDAPANRFEVEVSAESLARTVGLAEPGPVNLEKALRASDRLGGHLVSGHVAGVCQVERFDPVGESWLLVVRAPAELARFLAYKGSVAVDGVSLTVNQVQDSDAGCLIHINLIAHTVHHTALVRLLRGTRVNLEVDLIARYVERMLASSGALPTPTHPNTP